MLLLNGDCIEQMQKLKDEGKQIDSVVTDPPYHLTSIVERYGKEGSAPAKDKDGLYQRQARGFMGKEWDGGDIAFRADTWKLAYDLLKPGGYILAFSASRNYHRMAVAIEDAGFEIRDQIMWIYGSGFPKSHNIGKAVDAIEKFGRSDPKALRETRMGDDYEPTGQDDWSKGRMFSADVERIPDDDHEHEVTNKWKGWGTALKPAHEPIVMARKPLSEKSVATNVLKYGTGAINIDGCRIESDSDAKSRVRKAGSEFGQNSGWNDHKNVDTIYDPSKGRYPANLMHDGLQEEWARYFYCPKTSSAERNRGLEDFTAKPMAWGNQAKAEMKRGNLDFAADGDGTKHNKVAMRLNTHPTVKPQELMKYLCRLVTPKGGVVLDPFMGSGSTGMAAKDEGFDFIGIEREKEYFDIAEARIKVSSPLMDFME